MLLAGPAVEHADHGEGAGVHQRVGEQVDEHRC